SVEELRLLPLVQRQLRRAVIGMAGDTGRGDLLTRMGTAVALAAVLDAGNEQIVGRFGFLRALVAIHACLGLVLGVSEVRLGVPDAGYAHRGDAPDVFASGR